MILMLQMLIHVQAVHVRMVVHAKPSVAPGRIRLSACVPMITQALAVKPTPGCLQEDDEVFWSESEVQRQKR